MEIRRHYSEIAARLILSLAQSIFSHCGPDLISLWLQGISPVTKGAMLATFVADDTDCTSPGWHYPESVNYHPDSIKRFAEEAGFRFTQLDWPPSSANVGTFSQAVFRPIVVCQPAAHVEQLDGLWAAVTPRTRVPFIPYFGPSSGRPAPNWPPARLCGNCADYTLL